MKKLLIIFIIPIFLCFTGCVTPQMNEHRETFSEKCAEELHISNIGLIYTDDKHNAVNPADPRISLLMSFDDSTQKYYNDYLENLQNSQISLIIAAVSSAVGFFAMVQIFAAGLSKDGTEEQANAGAVALYTVIPIDIISWIFYFVSDFNAKDNLFKAVDTYNSNCF
ncbi:MAG: hypothetical protein JXR81_11020 [Candidatus Goldbacteria bacterium]|nr:hypothetical protein [Candidatus Goldiibacteriota bacterium]